MIKFKCPNCGQKLKVPDERAGRKGKCPKCGKSIVVPQAPQIADSQSLPTLNFADNKQPPTAPDILHIPPEPQSGNQPGEFGAVFPWARQTPPVPQSNASQQDVSSQGETEKGIVDMLAYPISVSGIIHVIIFFLLGLFIRPSGIPLCLFAPPIFRAILLVISTGYCLYYFTNCVRCSSSGERRAPDINSQPGSIDVITIICEFFAAVGWMAFCFAPPLVYLVVTGRADPVFILLVACAVLYAPISLLAIVLFDSVRALSPILIIPSILSVFVPYIGLLIGLAVVWAGAVLLYWLHPLLGIPSAYLVILSAHILGRFFMKYQDRLNWEA
ncbi:MAG: TFIIB-type zinc ribbon-containing protein [Planctomycetota bacterium]|jgi:DNA-directed RNA polymerase subunit RPC12/RpoP